MKSWNPDLCGRLLGHHCTHSGRGFWELKSTHVKSCSGWETQLYMKVSKYLSKLPETPFSSKPGIDFLEWPFMEGSEGHHSSSSLSCTHWWSFKANSVVPFADHDLVVQSPKNVPSFAPIHPQVAMPPDWSTNSYCSIEAKSSCGFTDRLPRGNQD